MKNRLRSVSPMIQFSRDGTFLSTGSRITSPPLRCPTSGVPQHRWVATEAEATELSSGPVEESKLVAR